jgi:chemotaxis protein histidine kinase CheA
MNLPEWLGYLAFFAVPLLLWVIASLVTQRKGMGARAFAFIAGSDNRLSLARLQALVWTLVIFGSFAAAMIIHDPITSGTTAEQEKAKNDAAAATKNASDLKKKVEEAEDLAGKAAAAKTEADKKAAKAAEEEKIKVADPKASEDDKTKAKAVAEKERSEATAKTEDLARKNEAAAKAKNDASQAEKGAKAANLKAKSYNWVDIPGALLMLAGIAIGSGVFSSLISALNGEDKTACVTAVKSKTAAEVANEFPEAKAPTTGSALLIEGKDLGATGLVKFGRDTDTTSPIRISSNGKAILFWRWRCTCN